MTPPLHALLAQLLVRGGSDLHLRTDEHPRIRVDGALHLLEAHNSVSAEVMTAMLDSLLTKAQAERFARVRALDLALHVPRVGRFRVNLFHQQGRLGLVARAIPDHLPSLDALGVPGVLHDWIVRPYGMILVTGPTGSGKSTTLAALLAHLNVTRPGHILTLEDPIEFVHTSARCTVSQREVGTDVVSFADGMREALRQDPDILMVGEMRDPDTMSAALALAETGHLVLSTLHTHAAAEAVIRLVQSFPAHAQDQIRTRISFSLLGVVTQVLVPRRSGAGRVLVAEVMVCTPAIRALIREDRVHQIPSAIQTGRRLGMERRDDALRRAWREGRITLSEARRFALDPAALPEGEVTL
jgi:twitching motility protein PilT